MSHIWSSQVGAVSQHCSQAASPGTACTNTCSKEEKETSSCLFTHTVIRTQFQKSTPSCSHFLWPCTVGAWEGERLTYPYFFQPDQPFRKLYDANRKRVNPQPRALSPCLTSLQCTWESDFALSVQSSDTGPDNHWHSKGTFYWKEMCQEIKREHKKSWLKKTQAIINTTESKY